MHALARLTDENLLFETGIMRRLTAPVLTKNIFMYTKEQRREIYLKALEAFTTKTYVAFMCHELSKAINAQAPFIYHDELVKRFPEWANCRPEGFSHSESNIWEDGETAGCSAEYFNALRKTILCLAIAQL